MSLIPLILGRASARAVPETAGPARYNPGGGHRPVAGVIAVGLPVALVVAVALSPFEVPLIHKPDRTTVINLPVPVPPPPPEPDEIVKKPQESFITAPPSPFPPVGPSPIDPVVDPLPIPTGPVIGTAPPVETFHPTPPPPPLVEAKLDPRYKSSFQPDYPSWEQRNEIEGTARVRVLVGTDGRVKDVVELASSSAGFFAETKRRALAKWRFKPATRGGTAEDSWVTMTVRFELSI